MPSPGLEDFSAQWVLSRDTQPPKAQWRIYKSNRFELQTGPDFPAGRLTDSRDRVVGFCLGIALDQNGQVIKGDIALPWDSATPEFTDRLEQWVLSLAGRYGVITDYGSTAQLYIDPAGELGAVYNAEIGAVASTLLLALHRPLTENPHFNFDEIARGSTIYTMGHTRDAQVKRMIPNHALDLNDFALRRIWPHPDEAFLPENSLEDTVSTVVTGLGRHVAALARSEPCLFALSSGWDSRMLLGASADAVKDLKFAFTHELTAAHKSHGVPVKFVRRARHQRKIAAQVAAHFGIDHKVCAAEPDPKLIENYDAITGYMPNRTNALNLTTLNELPRGHVAITGNIMELMRANQWKKFADDKPPNRVFALRRLLKQKNRDPEIAREYGHWADQLGAAKERHLYEMQFLEHWLPNTLGPKHYALRSCFTINPFNDRALIAATLRTPIATRKSLALIEAIIARVAPGLADVELL